MGRKHHPAGSASLGRRRVCGKPATNDLITSGITGGSTELSD